MTPNHAYCEFCEGVYGEKAGIKSHLGKMHKMMKTTNATYVMKNGVK